MYMLLSLGEKNFLQVYIEKGICLLPNAKEHIINSLISTPLKKSATRMQLGENSSKYSNRQLCHFLNRNCLMW